MSEGKSGMSRGLTPYLVDKKEALLQRASRLETETDIPAQRLSAGVRIAGRSGVREIRIRDFQLLSDSGPELAGFNLGPGSPELQLGVLGSCVSHITLIQAALRDIPLESVEVEVDGSMHPFAGKPGYEEVPVYLHDISYTLRIVSSASAERVTELHQVVEAACPILNLLLRPQSVSGRLEHRIPGGEWL